MKLFISQPMNGIDDAEILARRNKAIDHIHNLYPNQQIDVIDSFIKEDYGHPAKYLEESLKLMADADLAVFLGDYYNYRGCMIERLVCSRYGIRWMELREL